MSVEDNTIDLKPASSTSKNPNTQFSDPEMSHNFNEKTETPEIFVERQKLLINEKLEYRRDGKDPGYVLIFNQQTFKDQDRYEYRNGSRRDVNEIMLCLGRLGYNITEENVFSDLSKDKILKVIDIVASEDFTEINSLIVFFLSHGESMDKLYAKDDSISTTEIWKKFMSCESLKKKPKTFIFQACRNDRPATPVENEIPEKDADNKDGFRLVSNTTFSSNFMGPDMLIVYATTEGNVSFRDKATGSWFIQELCKNFTAYGKRDDVVSIIIRTAKCLGRNYFAYDGEDKEKRVQKQMPLFISTLTKKFYLNRNKDRSVLLKLIQHQEDLKKIVDDLNSTFEAVMK